MGEPRRDDARREHAPGPVRLWTPVFLLILTVCLGTFLAGQGLNAGTSVYVERLGGTATYAGILATVFSVTAAAVRFVAGPLVDRRGRRVVMTVGAAVMVVGTAGPLFSGELGLLVLWRLLQGVGFSCVTTAVATAAADVVPRERLGEGIGYFGLGQAVAMSVGPAVALALVASDPASNLFIGVTAAAVLALACALLCRYERDPRKLPATCSYRMRWEREQMRAGQGEAALEQAEQEDGDAARQERAALAAEGASADDAPSGDGTAPAEDASGRRGLRGAFARSFEPAALPGAAIAFLTVPAFSFGIFFVGLYGTHLGVGNAGLFYTVSAVVMIIVRLRSSAFMDRLPGIKIFTVAISGGVVAFALLFAAGQVASGPVLDAVFYAAGAFYGTCLGLCQPLNQTIAVRYSPPARLGAANALFQLGIDLGMGTATLVWGALSDVAGFGPTILCALGCLLVAYGAAWWIYPAPERRWTRQR